MTNAGICKKSPKENTGSLKKSKTDVLILNTLRFFQNNAYESHHNYKTDLFNFVFFYSCLNFDHNTLFLVVDGIITRNIFITNQKHSYFLLIGSFVDRKLRINWRISFNFTLICSCLLTKYQKKSVIQ